MNKYLVLAYFLIFLPSISLNDDSCTFDNGSCLSTYTPSGEEDDTKCILTSDYSSWQLKKCEQLDSNYCYLYGDFNQKTCIRNENGNGCQLKQCSDFKPPNCGKFDLEVNDIDQKCVSSGNNCILEKCSEKQKPNCGNFIPNDQIYRCSTASDDDTNCQILSKECKDIPYGECERINPATGENGEKFDCVGKADKNGCQLVSCKSQPKEKCQEFIPKNEDEKCVLKSDENKCELITCSGQKSNECGEFIPNNKSKKCMKKEDEDRCDLVYKQCNEFKNNECNDYNRWADENSYDQMCMPGENNHCSLRSCESFNVNQCQDFIYDTDEKLCINTGKSCELVACDDLSSNQCNIFPTENLEY